mmetsp:Transcript_147924/g.412002  ORF Transcript_147924/g.412002 Transcript_147924/m.412002 type:complete len:202 (+) Transcript_147924:395-1000(+)
MQSTGGTTSSGFASSALMPPSAAVRPQRSASTRPSWAAFAFQSAVAIRTRVGRTRSTMIPTIPSSRMALHCTSSRGRMKWPFHCLLDCAARLARYSGSGTRPGASNSGTALTSPLRAAVHHCPQPSLLLPSRQPHRRSPRWRASAARNACGPVRRAVQSSAARATRRAGASVGTSLSRPALSFTTSPRATSTSSGTPTPAA